jgi:DNA-binding NtrC family response regulator
VPATASMAPLGLIGHAPAFCDVVERLPTLAESEGTVLIHGETGTGKELVARAIHRLGPRAERPFVAVHCSSLTDNMVNGEFCGGGTLYLDEIDTLTPQGQVVLLRVIEDGIVPPDGASAPRKVDVRFLAAAHDPLDRLVEQGRFRADLYRRLSVFTVSLPPLRERREDILPLAEHFLAKHARSGVEPQLAPCAIRALLSCTWSGNVRELESAIVRGLSLRRNQRVEERDLDLPLPAFQPAFRLVLPESSAPYRDQKREVLDAFNRQFLARLMACHQGNVTEAARASGKERRDLGKLLKRYGVDPRRFSS